jgi:hypothetical protein
VAGHPSTLALFPPALVVPFPRSRPACRTGLRGTAERVRGGLPIGFEGEVGRDDSRAGGERGMGIMRMYMLELRAVAVD